MDDFIASLPSKAQALEVKNKNGELNDMQLELVLRVLEEERKRQEEIRKTKELELEILRLRESMQKTEMSSTPSSSSGAQAGGKEQNGSSEGQKTQETSQQPATTMEMPYLTPPEWLHDFTFTAPYSQTTINTSDFFLPPTTDAYTLSTETPSDFLHDLQNPLQTVTYSTPPDLPTSTFDVPVTGTTTADLAPSSTATFSLTDPLPPHGVLAMQNISMENVFREPWTTAARMEICTGMPAGFPSTAGNQFLLPPSTQFSLVPTYGISSTQLTDTSQMSADSLLLTQHMQDATGIPPNQFALPQHQPHTLALAQLSSATRTPSNSTRPPRDPVSRKKITENPVYCKRCKNHIATFLLHPESKNVPQPSFNVDIVCNTCEGGSPLPAPDQPLITGRRKRSHDDHGMDCEICKRRIGSGGFRFGDSDELQGVGVGGKVRDEDGVMVEEAVEFRVEPICVGCRTRYRFCTECGGGGKYRTGKYRPVELFAANRRTCLLSHVRLGGAPVVYKVLSAPSQISESLYSECREVHMDGFYGLYATPEVIEARMTNLSSYAKVDEWAKKGWKSAEELLRNDGAKEGLRRYLAVVYVDKPQSRVRGATIKRIKANAKAPNAESTTSDEDASSTPSIQVAYGSAEWDLQNGTLLFANGYVRTTTVSTLPILRGMHERLLRAVLHDSSLPEFAKYPPVQHVWMLARRDHLRVQSYVERMGFRPVEEYVKGGVDGSVFERRWHVPKDLFRCFVCGVGEFLRDGEREGAGVGNNNGGGNGAGGYRGVWR